MVIIGYSGVFSLAHGAFGGRVFEKDGVHLGIGGMFGVIFFCLLNQSSIIITICKTHYRS